MDRKIATPLLLLSAATALAAGGAITIDAGKPGPRIPSSLYGIFFEEISHAGEGGLYGELLQNRGFEDANLPPSCSLEGNKLVPPRTPSYWNDRVSDWTLPWNVTSKWPGWRLETVGGAAATIDLVESNPLNQATPHSLAVTSTAGGRAALINEGFWGIGVKQGDSYQLSFYAHGDGMPINAALESKDGKALATATVTTQRGDAWHKYQATLTATATDPKAQFAMMFGAAGKVYLDFVSLFPARTFHNRPNGLRADLAQMVADLKPAFMRFPGGCYVEGITIQSRPQWKTTLGPVEQRVPTYSPWGYWTSNGIGYHEFLQFSEDIGAEALYVANAGISCAFRSGTYIKDEDLEPVIQDTLDAIEYAIGPVSSKWGAERAKNGHPAPFPLKYIEVGNEDQGARYGARFARFYTAIKARYPKLNVALDSWIAGVDRQAMTGAGKFDILDEHEYKPVHWAVENFDFLGKYKREGWDLYIGEFATNAGVGHGNLAAALDDAAFLMTMEKNSDLVKMGSYAPLLENVNKADWPVNMIHFDASRIFARATYYVNKLFDENRPDVNLSTTVDYQPASPRPIAGRIGLSTYNTAAEYKDVKVESGGQVLYRSDFSRDAGGWQPQRGRNAGTWAVADGVYRQSDHAVAWTYYGDDSWKDITFSVEARKISGDEGFIVSVGNADGRRIQWNVGGWGNRQHAIQAADGIVGEVARGSVETGRWYLLKVEVRGRSLKCYLDGVLTNQFTLPRIDTVLAIAGKDEKTGEMVVKVINTSSQPAAMSVVVKGAHPSAQARLITLTSANPTDENSFEEPLKIAPKETILNRAGDSFAHEFPPYSLTVLRMKI